MIYSDMDDRNGTPVVLTVPGLGNSGPGHWQTIWEQTRGDCQRVELGLWDAPLRAPWVTKLAQAVSSARPPVILVAHSLGCHAVAWWARQDPQPYGWPVAAALLVAPPDLEGASAPAEVRQFSPTPQAPLPFPSLLIASSDDPYASIERSHDLAMHWGSHFVDAGAQGHLNAASGLGGWSFGQRILDRLIDGVAAGGAPHRGSPARIDWPALLQPAPLIAPIALTQ